MKIESKHLFFFFVAVGAITVHFVLFLFRYAWYLKNEDFNFIFFGYALCVIGIVAAWKFFPSRIFVMIIGLFAFVFPPAFRGNSFAEIDIRFTGFLAASLILLVGATELRRRCRGSTA